MIFCCVNIDYYSQIERSGVKSATNFLEAVKSITSHFGAKLNHKKMPITFSFSQNGFFSKIQTAEALERLYILMGKSEIFLRGATITVHDSETQEEALEESSFIRCKNLDNYSFIFTDKAKAFFSNYFCFDEESNSFKSKFIEKYLDSDASILFEQENIVSNALNSIEKARQSNIRLLHIESSYASRLCRPIAQELSKKYQNVLLLSSLGEGNLSFSPLTEAIVSKGPLEEKKENFEYYAFLQSSSSAYKKTSTRAISKGTAIFINNWLDEFGNKNGIIICNHMENFNAESLELIRQRLFEGTGKESYISVSENAITDEVAGPWAARTICNQTKENKEKVIENALGNTVGVARTSLENWFKCITGVSKDIPKSVCVNILKSLPEEALLYLYGLLIPDNKLTSQEMSELFTHFGLYEDGEKLLQTFLQKIGFLDIANNNVLYCNFNIVKNLISKEYAEIINKEFATFLIDLYKKGRILPSLGFLNYVGEFPDEENLLYDCLFDDFMNTDYQKQIDPHFLSPSSLAMYQFWHPLMSGQRSKAEAAANLAEEKITNKQKDVINHLIQAELYYANGDSERAIKNARTAMIALDKWAPKKLEVRCQRIMGYAAFAGGKFMEASDYLTNAQEMAESFGDEYEKMMSSYCRAILYFEMGAIGKTIKSLEQSSSAAKKLYRVDIEAAIQALYGRIDFELGLYDDAFLKFQDLEKLENEYVLPGVAKRARVWQGRALSYSGKYSLAKEIFLNNTDDFEARVFFGELELLEAQPEEAKKWLSIDSNEKTRRWRASDTICWDSLFSQIEGRCLGFSAVDFALQELQSALLLFSQGLIEKDPKYAVDLYSLAKSSHQTKINPASGIYSFMCYLLEEELEEPPVDKPTILSRAFSFIQLRAGYIEDKGQRTLYLERNIWNKKLQAQARLHKFI